LPLARTWLMIRSSATPARLIAINVVDGHKPPADFPAHVRGNRRPILGLDLVHPEPTAAPSAPHAGTDRRARPGATHRIAHDGPVPAPTARPPARHDPRNRASGSRQRPKLVAREQTNAAGDPCQNSNHEILCLDLGPSGEPVYRRRRLWTKRCRGQERMSRMGKLRHRPCGHVPWRTKPTPDPTVTTLARYAEALGRTLVVSFKVTAGSRVPTGGAVMARSSRARPSGPCRSGRGFRPGGPASSRRSSICRPAPWRSAR